MSNIRIPLELVRARLNEFINAAEPRGSEWVVLSNLVDPAGVPVQGAADRLVMYLAGIEKETLVSTSGAAVAAAAAGASLVPPPLYVQLRVLLMANFSGPSYAEGLGVIAHAISFFQQNPSFTPETLPGLPPEVERLTWNLSSLDPADLRCLMGLAGVKYLPAVCYQVGLLPFRSGAGA
jgi:hypothetical protein